ncbi:MAG: DUF924 domain-containing protein [Rhodanobacteraceae bacterium]|nr:DUF924 domain-containing protein [Rhodanobacteraceae bacterium]MBL0042798.1 DUF924 domain-containing protein [Xanthomonadales bacterium]MBP6079598.1 DUF924 domain-containing protein [Xanthomonadales bacterium]MBP7624788.1 DUF924 domain-containing protein [Xanthomonadales bacterium]
MHHPVLDFWFREIDPAQWWRVDAAFDELIRSRFLDLHRQAAAGELFAWRATAQGRLAEIIVLDQFSRNLFRGTPGAFAQDGMALVLAQEAVAASAHESLIPVERGFLFLPYMHSESRRVHVEAERLYREFALPGNHDFELKHQAIIDRFGRYPHRNAILGRASTVEEIEFLKQPGSSF